MDSGTNMCHDRAVNHTLGLRLAAALFSLALALWPRSAPAAAPPEDLEALLREAFFTEVTLCDAAGAALLYRDLLGRPGLPPGSRRWRTCAWGSASSSGRRGRRPSASSRPWSSVSRARPTRRAWRAATWARGGAIPPPSCR